MSVEDEASQCTMEAADEINVDGTETMPTAIPDPPETGGVEVMRIRKGNPPRNAGIVGNGPVWKRSYNILLWWKNLRM